MKWLKRIMEFNKISNYWHVEAIILIPFAIWFIWRVETIIRLLS